MISGVFFNHKEHKGNPTRSTRDACYIRNP